MNSARALLKDRQSDEVLNALAEALAAKGHCHRNSSALAEAVAHCSEAAELFAKLGNGSPESLARSQWGIALVQLGDLSGGLAQLERALNLSIALGDEQHVCDCWVDIGVINNMMGNDARAIELYAQAMPVFERNDDHYHHATCLSNAAFAHTCWGRREREHGNEPSALSHFAEAQALARRAIALAKLGDDLDFLTLRYVTLAEAEREAGDLAACLKTLETQLPLTEKLAAKRTQVLCLVRLADALAARAEQGDEAQALAHLTTADVLCQSHSLMETHGGVLRSLTNLHEKFNRPSDALAAFKRFHDVEIHIRTEAAETATKTLEARLRVEHIQRALDLANQREAELTSLNTRLRDQQFALERLAHVDSLTGLANRRAWLASLENAWALDAQNLYVYLLDLDHFKEINDAHGHSLGDEVLVATARLVEAAVGSAGQAGRFGGEEFVVWMHSAQPADASALANRLLTAVASHSWRSIAATMKVTASVGWCAAHTHNTPFAALTTADENMYLAKRAGRNRMIGSVLATP